MFNVNTNVSWKSPVKATRNEGKLGRIGGWNKRIAFSPVVLKENAMSPFLHPGTSMYDWDVVKVTTYF